MRVRGTAERPAPERSSFRLEDGEAHVWHASLVRTPQATDRLRRLLSPDELERAAKLRFERHQRRFVVARGILRALLGRYLRVHPSELSFSYGHHGKPTLDGPYRTGPHFNLSHSHEVAVYVVARGRHVGIDVERVRTDVAAEQIADHYFSRRELAALRALPAEARPEAFFTCWARKEAYLKARGEGLSFPLDQFDVSLAPGLPAALLATQDDPAEAARWSMVALETVDGYAGALVVEGPLRRLRYWRWPDDDRVLRGAVP